MRAAVLVPVKDFRAAKGRLASHLTPTTRQELARRMAACVVAAGQPLPTFVVCDDPAVAEWADEHDATVLWRPAYGLNGAVTSGVAALTDEGYERVVIAHSDLPLARDLARLASDEPNDVVIVPDRHDRGTNVLSIPTGREFSVGYGVGSFLHHQTEARQHGLTVHIVRDPLLGWDVDVPADLDHPELKEFLAWMPTSRANRP